MHVISAENPGEAWVQGLRLVFDSGQPIKDGKQQLLESLQVTFEVANPLIEDTIVEQWGDPEMLAWMSGNFLDTKPMLDWGYSYGQRLQNFGGENQLKNTVDQLKRNPETKSATMGFLNPPGDKKHRPCIISYDFKIRDGKLVGAVFARSQDVVKKLYADIISLGRLLETVANGVGVPVGPLVLYTVSLHAYESDFDRGREILAGL